MNADPNADEDGREIVRPLAPDLLISFGPRQYS
jgi:hypothetical protein